MAVWWCCMCGVETRRDSEMVCGDCRAQNRQARTGFGVFQVVNFEALKAPATASDNGPGSGRLNLKASRHMDGTHG